MRKQDLVRQVASALGQRDTEAARSVNAVFSAIESALANGDEVTISGFGAFKVVDRPERKVRSPQTGELLTVEARRSPVFRPGSQLKRSIG